MKKFKTHPAMALGPDELAAMARTNPKAAMAAASAMARTGEASREQWAARLGALIISTQDAKSAARASTAPFMAQMLSLPEAEAVSFAQACEAPLVARRNDWIPLLDPERAWLLDQKVAGLISNAPPEAWCHSAFLCAQFRMAGLLAPKALLAAGCAAYYRLVDLRNGQAPDNASTRAFATLVDQIDPGWTAAYWQTYWSLTPNKHGDEAEAWDDANEDNPLYFLGDWQLAFFAEFEGGSDPFASLNPVCLSTAQKRLILPVARSCASSALSARRLGSFASLVGENEPKLWIEEGDGEDEEARLRVGFLTRRQGFILAKNNTARALCALADHRPGRLFSRYDEDGRSWTALAEAMAEGGAEPPQFVLELPCRKDKFPSIHCGVSCNDVFPEIEALGLNGSEGACFIMLALGAAHKGAAGSTTLLPWILAGSSQEALADLERLGAAMLSIAAALQLTAPDSLWDLEEESGIGVMALIQKMAVLNACQEPGASMSARAARL